MSVKMPFTVSLPTGTGIQISHFHSGNSSSRVIELHQYKPPENESIPIPQGSQPIPHGASGKDSSILFFYPNPDGLSGSQCIHSNHDPLVDDTADPGTARAFILPTSNMNLTIHEASDKKVIDNDTCESYYMPFLFSDPVTHRLEHWPNR